ncbi:ABC transporter [Paenibacillus sp. J31TS4]|uniref:ABC transporter ATP-binding protein n=1 Tax=Paenibacillus sp. J31TS4 TaxID=2807195 RepID=UPI001B18F9A9|nr:ATP-binding cassette domain-containing protein [Paenibacillus sp. J31TS4]GIP41275.1 ABC transporter [Paenibacillus sp. J31TS4]
MTALTVEGLAKRFVTKHKQEGLAGSMRALLRPQTKEKIAVHPIAFTVQEGESVAFLGPNGAGKSTTIKMLTGILHPSEGYAEVLGLCPWKERQRLAYGIGSVFGQKSQLWYHLPASDSFELMSRIYEMGREDYRRRRSELVERFGIGPYLHMPVRRLSLGERMRCEIAAALLHRPRVVFLDEPTIGLDVIAKQTIREAILEMNREEGTTLFITSHDSGDVEQLCDRAIVINYGRIILDDPVPEMKRKYLTYKRIRLELEEPAEEIELPGVEVLRAGGTALELGVRTEEVRIEEVLGAIVGRFRVKDVTIEDPPMEEVISFIYGKLGKEGG